MRDDTEPFEQLVSEEDVYPSRKARELRERREKKRYQSRDYKSSEDWPEGPPRDYAEEVPNLSHGESLLRALLDFLLLSKDPWRLTMGLVVIFLMLNTGASRGWISIPGFPMLAEAANVTEIRIEQLEEQIENAVKGHCLAPNSEAKSYYYRKVRELRSKFERASDDDHAPRPTCKDLGVREVVVSEF